MAAQSGRRLAPTVSVVIPCRDAAAWIGETVASVASQTGVTSETIVVDDGSVDASVEIARKAGRSVRVLRQPPSGVSAARALGTTSACGDFVQYLDADDVLAAPDTLSRRVAALEADAADVAYTDYIKWVREADGTFVDRETCAPRLGERADVDVFAGAWWPPGALLYRRTAIAGGPRWRCDLPVIQDARFLFEVAAAGARFVHVPGVGLRYRIHGPSSLSRRDPAAFLDDCYRSTIEIAADWTRAGLDDARRRALVRVYGWLARECFVRDRARFDDVLGRLHAIEPGYVPASPRGLRLLSRLIGYVPAEHVAQSWRRVKRVFTT